MAEIRLMFRLWKADQLIPEDPQTVKDYELDQVLPALAEKHGAALATEPHMIETEFLDEPDPRQRFFRMGTDPAGMVKPIAVSPESIESTLGLIPGYWMNETGGILRRRRSLSPRRSADARAGADNAGLFAPVDQRRRLARAGKLTGCEMRSNRCTHTTRCARGCARRKGRELIRYE